MKKGGGMTIVDTFISKFVYFLAASLLVLALSTGYAIAHMDGANNCYGVECTE